MAIYVHIHFHVQGHVHVHFRLHETIQFDSHSHLCACTFTFMFILVSVPDMRMCTQVLKHLLLANRGNSTRYFDVRVFNPLAPLNRNSHPASCYRKHELLKKRPYLQRVREIKHASYTPLVLSATGGMATVFYEACLMSGY